MTANHRWVHLRPALTLLILLPALLLVGCETTDESVAEEHGEETIWVDDDGNPLESNKVERAPQPTHGLDQRSIREHRSW